MQKIFEKNRNLIFIPVSVMMFTTGFPSIWSVFQADAVARYGISLDGAATLVMMCSAFYGVFYILGGKLSERFPNRLCALFGVCLMCRGILSLGLLGNGTKLLTLILLFSLPYGAGCGIIFPAMNPPFLRWFVDKNGFAYGFVCAMYSVLSMGMTYMANFLLKNFGMQQAVIFIAAAYFVVSAVSCYFFISPTDEYMAGKMAQSAKKAGDEKPRVKMTDFTTKEMLSTKQYYLLLATGILAYPRHLLIIPSGVTMGMSRGLSEATAVSMVAFSLGVAAIAQLAVPSLSDKTGRKPAFRFMLLIVLASSVVLSFARGGVFVAAFLALVFAYSAWIVLMTPFANDLFGLKYAGTNTGFVNIYNSAASFLSPVVLSALSVLLGSGARHIIAVTGCTLAIICLSMIDTDTSKLKSQPQS